MESYDICLSLTYFTYMIDSRSIHAAANGIILFFFWLHNIPLYTCTTSYLSIPLSVQSLSHVGLFATPWTAAHQASLSITEPQSYSSSCPSSWWCHPTTSSSVFSSPQSFPASGSFQMSQLFISGGQSIGVSASTSALLMNIQDWFPLG